jgi:hypothetical protein
MKSALAELYLSHNSDAVPKRTLQALIDRGFVDSKEDLTESGRITVIESMSLLKQCDYLSIELDRIPWVKPLKPKPKPFVLQYLERKGWVKTRVKPLKPKPEPFALQYFERKGYVGAYCEGGAIGTAIKALCLDALTESSIFYGTSIDAREDACLKGVVALSHLESDNLKLALDQIEHVSKSKYLKAFSEIISYRDIQEWYPGLTLDFAGALYDALPKSIFIQIAKWISLDSYNRNGWPDLTLIKDNTVRFVEVKTTDKLHASQLITIPEIVKETGLKVSVLKLDKQANDSINGRT